MRRPPLRDADHPWGFDVNDPQTRTGTLLANRACQVMKVADQNNAVGVLDKAPTSMESDPGPSFGHDHKSRFMPVRINTPEGF